MRNVDIKVAPTVSENEAPRRFSKPPNSVRRLSKRTAQTGLIFLGSSAAIQVPSFHCTCRNCNDARANTKHRRTRASIALVGSETILIDATPDIEFQLEREAIRQVDRIFLTHWHFDHVWGFAALGEPSHLAKWRRIETYLPCQLTYHFDQELEWMQDRVSLHPIKPGDKFRLPDATWEVVKTTHTDHSVGFIVESTRKFAYLVDGVVPPRQTVERLRNLDFIILEATVDKLVPREGEKWFNFSLEQAVEFWRQVGTPECILTHLSCHSYKKGKLLAGLTHSQRAKFEEENLGLKFAHDGMRVEL
ncbi:MAG: MBL fold metallo-hydrolase [Candidatus Bathyarchaeota archaeon]|nr:MAG: MBL fold metallo-hydrolase [Candidatus Bathyarchaeota archaeon]